MEINLVGMRFVRQQTVQTTVATLLAGLRSGEATLVRERAHPLDPFAVGVHVGGERLAYVSAQQNRPVARLLLRVPPEARIVFRDIRAKGTACITVSVSVNHVYPPVSARDPPPRLVPGADPDWVREIMDRSFK